MQPLTVKLPKYQKEFFEKNIFTIHIVPTSSQCHYLLWAPNVRSFIQCVNENPNPQCPKYVPHAQSEDMSDCR